MRTPSKVDTGNPGEYTIKKFVKYEVHGPGKLEGQPKLDEDGKKIIIDSNTSNTELHWIEGIAYEIKKTSDVDAKNFKGQIE